VHHEGRSLHLRVGHQTVPEPPEPEVRLHGLRGLRLHRHTETDDSAIFEEVIY